MPGALREVIPTELTAGPATRTRIDGSFCLPLEDGDQVILRVEGRGLARIERIGVVAGERLELFVPEGRPLHVQVHGPRGKPVRDVALGLALFSERASMSVVRRARTDEDGSVRFEAVPSTSFAGSVVVLEAMGSAPSAHDLEPLNPDLNSLWTHRLQLPAVRKLEGTVLDAKTGAPVTGARLSTNEHADPRGTTDASGHFELRMWSARGVVQLLVQAEGYVPAWVDHRAYAKRPIELAPASGFRGRVLTRQGHAASGALVFGVRKGASGDQRLPQHTYTDARGRFDLGGLRKGRCTLRAYLRGHGRATRTETLYKTRQDLGDWTLATRCKIRGTVVAGDGQLAPGQWVQLSSTDDSLHLNRSVLGNRRTDDRGRFVLPDLEPGRYRLKVGEREGATTELAVELTDARPIRTLDIQIPATRQVTLYAVDLADEPVSGVRVTARGEDGTKTMEQTTDEAGQAVFDLPWSVQEFVVAEGDPHGRRHRCAVAAAHDITDVTLVVTRALAVDGRILDVEGEPIANARIEFDTDTGRSGWTHSELGGHFSIDLFPEEIATVHYTKPYEVKRPVPEDLPVDEYLDAVRASLEPDYWHARAEGVRASDGDLLLRAETIVRDQRLAVRLVSPEGRPVPGVRLYLSKRNQIGQYRSTDADGRAHFVRQPPLVMTLHCSAWLGSATQPWIAPDPKKVTPAGQEIELCMLPGLPLEVHVRRSDGSPVDVVSYPGGVLEARPLRASRRPRIEAFQPPLGMDVLRPRLADPRVVRNGSGFCVLDPRDRGPWRVSVQILGDWVRGTRSSESGHVRVWRGQRHAWIYVSDDP